MNVTLVVVTLIIMFVGLAGTILPMLPGLVLIYAGFLFYGFATAGSSTVCGLCSSGSCGARDIRHRSRCGICRARKYGASRYGFWGSFIGAFAGLVVANLPGLIIGAFLGAFCGELLAGKSGYEAVRSGKGALIGLSRHAFQARGWACNDRTFLWWVLA